MSAASWPRTVGLSIAIAGAASLLVLFVATRPEGRVLAAWQCPPALYGEPYFLSAITTDLDWRGFPLELRRYHELRVARSEGSDSYGHAVDWSFTAGYEDLETYVQRSTVTWEADGVTLAEPTGHRVFIPAASFRGGR